MKNLTDQQKGSLLAFVAVMFITPDSLFIRLSNVDTWGLVFYRGIIPFITVLLGMLIIYKLNFINFMIFKLLVNVKFANIINIINNKEVIPELLQSECNAKEIFNSVLYMLKNPEIGRKQLEQCNQTLKGIRSNSSSSNEVATILRNSLVG